MLSLIVVQNMPFAMLNWWYCAKITIPCAHNGACYEVVVIIYVLIAGVQIDIWDSWSDENRFSSFARSSMITECVGA